LFVGKKIRPRRRDRSSGNRIMRVMFFCLYSGVSRKSGDRVGENRLFNLVSPMDKRRGASAWKRGAIRAVWSFFLNDRLYRMNRRLRSREGFYKPPFGFVVVVKQRQPKGVGW
jgi:hypothetical protein